MPFDANGNFSLVPGTIVSDGMTIQPSQHNPPLQDFASGMSMVVVRDGRAPMTGPLNMNGFKVTGIADGTADTDAATVGQSALRIGDFKDTVRPLDSTWLKRDGSIYASANYPSLSAFFPPLPDGLLWERQTPVSGVASITKVASGPDSIVVIVQNQSALYRSSDGTSWTAVSLTFEPKTIAWGGGRYVVLGDDKKSAISTDGGENWSFEDTTLDPSLSGDVKYSNGLFATTNVDVLAPSPRSKISTSIDGVVWTTRRTAPDLRTYRVLIGDNNGFVGRDADSFYVSPDGLVWNQVSTDRSLLSVLAGVRGGSGRCIFVGSGGLLFTTDGFSTTVERASGTVQALNDVFSMDPYIVAVGNSGVSRISSDNGSNFISSPTGSSMSLTSISKFMSEVDRIIVSGDRELAYAIRTSSSQFAVPDDNPEYGWIKAL